MKAAEEVIDELLDWSEVPGHTKLYQASRSQLNDDEYLFRLAARHVKDCIQAQIMGVGLCPLAKSIYTLSYKGKEWGCP